jgi:hypothetical protein
VVGSQFLPAERTDEWGDDSAVDAIVAPPASTTECLPVSLRAQRLERVRMRSSSCDQGRMIEDRAQGGLGAREIGVLMREKMSSSSSDQGFGCVWTKQSMYEGA